MISLLNFIGTTITQSSTLALETKTLDTIGDGEGFGNLNKITNETSALSGITSIISAVVGFMTIAAGIWFLFQFIIGGFYWITAGGDKSRLEQSRDRITNAIVGLLVVVSSYAILAITAKFTGVDFLISDPGHFLQIISPK